VFLPVLFTIPINHPDVTHVPEYEMFLEIFLVFLSLYSKYSGTVSFVTGRLSPVKIASSIVKFY